MGRVLLLVAFAAQGAGASAEEPERHPLLRIADANDPGRADALAAWQALTDLGRTKEARAALRSEDPALAFAAAVTLSPWSLDLAELRLRSKAMERDPIAWFDPPAALKEVADGNRGYGAPDLPAIWRACVARDLAPETMSHARLHHPLLPEQVPALVPLLDAGPVTFRALLDDIRRMAESVGDSPHHDAYVRAFRYGLLRLRAEHDKKKQPKFADVSVVPAKAGVPAEFLELARGCWGGDGGGFELGGLPEEARREGLKVTSTQGRGPEAWMHRWALRLTPVGEDAPFLVELLESRAPAVTKAWAARAIARLDGRAAGHALARMLGNGGAERVWAAAERATRGDRTAWNGLANAVGLGNEGAAALGIARWRADPVAARASAWKQLQDGDLPAELVQDERWLLAHDYGVEIAGEHLDWIAARLLSGDAPIATEMAFFSQIHPDWLTRERAEGLANRWLPRAKSVPYLSEEQRRAVGLLEAFAPEPTRAFLRAVATETEDVDVRPIALELLAQLGGAVPLHEQVQVEWPDPSVLGRVRTPEVEAFLRARAEGAPPAGDPTSDGGLESMAVAALAVFYGCPEPLAAYLGPAAREDKELTADTWAAVKKLVLAKDPIGAVLRRTHGGPFVSGVREGGICGFGIAKDPRVVERLELWRDRREFELYWVATACLAMQGDEQARTEWRGFLADARTFLLDSLQLWWLFTLNGDPEWTDEWVGRLDASCCSGSQAQECMRASFPTFPFRHYSDGAGRTRRGAEAWFARHKGTFVWSPILYGWIPGPRK